MRLRRGLVRRQSDKPTACGDGVNQPPEHVNRKVAALLEKLRAEFTRWRPRHSTDNALVESRDASVVRRHLGHAHIPACLAPLW